jgi:hypothetical protein
MIEDFISEKEHEVCTIDCFFTAFDGMNHSFAIPLNDISDRNAFVIVPEMVNDGFSFVADHDDDLADGCASGALEAILDERASREFIHALILVLGHILQPCPPAPG